MKKELYFISTALSGLHLDVSTVRIKKCFKVYGITNYPETVSVFTKEKTFDLYYVISYADWKCISQFLRIVKQWLYRPENI